MLTTKNLVRNFSWIFLTAALLLSGCTPPGPAALREGCRLLDQGRYPQAVERLTLAASLLSTNALTWNCLGVACHYAGKTLEAERAYTRALQLDRDLAEAHYNLGRLWLNADNLEGARLELTAYTLRRPNSLDGLLCLASAQLRSRDIASAERTFADALRLSPQDPQALNGLGIIRVLRGRAAEGAAFFNSALEKRPDFPPALLNLAIVSEQYLHDGPFALQKYRRYLALKPAPPNSEAIAAVARQLEQDLTPAAHPSPLVTSVPAVATTPPPKPAATNGTPRLVRVLPPAKTDLATNSPKPLPSPAQSRPLPPPPAIQAAHPPAADAIKPPSEPPPKTTVEAKAKPQPQPAPVVKTELSNSPPPTARPSAEGYAYLSPPKPPVGNRTEAQRAFDQGLANQEARRLPEAIQAYHLATKLDPSYFEAQYNLGHTATEEHNLPLALTAYECALAIKPDSTDARYNFALVLQQASYLGDAARELERLLVLDPNDPRAHLALANLYAQHLHQLAKARAHYLRALELNPQLPQAAAIRNWLATNPG